MSAPSGDIRGPACERRREKERRVKTRGVNVNLIGQPINPWVPNSKAAIKGSTTWNSRNQYRMREDLFNNPCHCASCKRERARDIRKKQAPLHIKDVAATSSYAPRKTARPVLNRAAPDDYIDGYMDSAGSSDDDYDDGYVDGVMYSFDNTHSPDGAYSLDKVVDQAYEVFQTKEFTKLVKNEYDLVNESDAEEDFELV